MACTHPVLDYSHKPPRCTECSAPVVRANHGPQTEFLSSTVYEVLYGGAAGGGKTWSLLLDALRYVSKPNYRAAIFRRTGPELEYLVDQSTSFYPSQGARFRAPRGRRFWQFPSGARIYFGSMEHEDDALKHSSYEFQYLGFDELTTFEEKQYNLLLSRVRSPSSDIACYVRSATNPIGPGYDWVLWRFRWWLYRPGERVEEFAGPYAAPGEVLWVYKDPVSGEERLVDPQASFRCANCRRVWPARGPVPQPEKLGHGDDPRCKHLAALSRTFIPALLRDNPPLATTDYSARLDGLDPLTRTKLKEANWMMRAAPGNFFRREWFRFCEVPPPRAALRVRYWDRAGTSEQDSATAAWTVGALVSRDTDGRFYVEDVVRERLDASDVPQLVLATARRDDALHQRPVVQWLEQDPGNAGKFEVGAIIRLCAGHDVRAVRPTGDKVTRARPVAAQAAPPASNVFLVRGVWNATYVDECVSFPGGYKDQVDATSGAFFVLGSASDTKSSAAGQRPHAASGGGGF